MNPVKKLIRQTDGPGEYFEYITVDNIGANTLKKLNKAGYMFFHELLEVEFENDNAGNVDYKNVYYFKKI